MTRTDNPNPGVKFRQVAGKDLQVADRNENDTIMSREDLNTAQQLCLDRTIEAGNRDNYAAFVTTPKPDDLLKATGAMSDAELIYEEDLVAMITAKLMKIVERKTDGVYVVSVTRKGRLLAMREPKYRGMS